MASRSRAQKRCAVYTRKSSEEGLEQDFNSLDAQREACLAYIQSQKSEGWRPVRTHYDDGGFSGGNLERPALAKLLADIEAGKIDTVVVYKVDRLTRSLTDFAKIVEVMDTAGISFVSVTQQFNTTTSMGRLTLNMLLSFAQFEREVTGERIRDKIAASKRKGLWMGGRVPLGYRAKGRTLEIVQSEAKTVRLLFERYLALGSVSLLKTEADERGLRTKRVEDKRGLVTGGRPFSRGNLYRLLGNPLYAGQIAHRGMTYEGQHHAIIDLKTWEKVQKRLAKQAPARGIRGQRTESSPLSGKIFDESGRRLTPSHTVKGARRYRYYVTREDGASGAQSSEPESGERRAPRWRLPAGEIERAVSNSVRNLLRDRKRLKHALREAHVLPQETAGLIDRASGWRGDAIEFVERVEVARSTLHLVLDLSPLDRAVKRERGMASESDQSGPIRAATTIPVEFRRRGVEQKLVVPGATDETVLGPKVDPSLVRVIARAHRWFSDLVTGRVRSFQEVAQAEGLSEQYVGNVIKLAFLSPAIIERILKGTHSPELTAERLVKRTDVRPRWADQEESLAG